MKTDCGKPGQSLSDKKISSDDWDVSFVFAEGFLHCSKWFSLLKCCYLIEVYFLSSKLFSKRLVDCLKRNLVFTTLRQTWQSTKLYTSFKLNTQQWLGRAMGGSLKKEEEVMAVISTNQCWVSVHCVNLSWATTHMCFEVFFLFQYNNRQPPSTLLKHYCAFVLKLTCS